MITKLSQNEDFTIVTKGGGRIVAPNIVAEPQFNPTAAYAKDAKVWYGSISYICTSATTAPEEGHSNPTPEEDTAHWSELPVEEMAKKSEVDTLMPLLFSQYYPDGNVKSAAEFTPGIKYDDPDTSNRTITVRPFCDADDDSEDDNSNLEGRVVIPPFVDAQRNPHISDDGTRYKVVGVSNGSAGLSPNFNLTAIVAPNTMTSIGNRAFHYCISLASVSFPAATSIQINAFNSCTALTSVSLPAATTIGSRAFYNCTSLTSVALPVTTTIAESAFDSCSSLTSVDFGDMPRLSVPSLGAYAFDGVPTACKIIVPDSQYDAWIAASGWSSLVTQGYKFLKHSEWEYARKYEVSKEIQDAIKYAVVVDDKLVPTEGPSSEEVFSNGSYAATYLAEHLPYWTCNDTNQSVVLRNRYGWEPAYYHYDLSLFTDRIVFWTEGNSVGDQGVFTRSVIFPKSGVYTLDIEYAAGYASYPSAIGQARFVVDAGTSGPQDVIGVNDPSIVQHAQVQFAANAGAGSISVKGKKGLSGNACCVVIASVKVVLVKEIGIEIGDIVAPDASAQTGQAADAKATHDQLAGKATKVDATLTPIYSDTPTFSEWVFSPEQVTDPGGGVHGLNVSFDSNSSRWLLRFSDGSYNINSVVGTLYDTSLQFPSSDYIPQQKVTATRTRTDIIGYTLGKQTDKPIASVEPLLFAQYYPDGNVKSAAEFTAGIKYTLTSNATERTATVKPFCITGSPSYDNSSLAGRVVIPPFVDAQGNPYISDDGTRFKVVGVSGDVPEGANTKLIAIIAPNTVTTIGGDAFARCTSLASVSLPAATTIGGYSFVDCTSLTSVSLPVAESVGASAFYGCTSLAVVDFGATPRSSVPTLGADVFFYVPTTCKIIVPDAQYDAWTAETIPDPKHEGETIANPWYALVQAGYTFLRHSELEYARKYELDGKLDSTSVAPAFSTSATYSVGEHVTHEGRLYECSEAVTASGDWNPSKWTDDDMTSPDATLDITTNGQLRLVSANGEQLWAQGYDLATESSSSLRCDRVNLFSFEATTAAAFSDSATYSVGERVAYSGKVYACTTAVATAGAWTGSANWDEDPDTQTFEMPPTANGKVGDFIVDVDNTANTVETAAALDGLGNSFSVVVQKGESVFDLLTFAPGELSELYFTQTAFRVNDLPTWKLVKNVVEDGGAQS